MSGHMEVIFPGADHADVVGRLHRAFHPFTHLDHAVGYPADCTNQGHDGCAADDACRLFTFADTLGGQSFGVGFSDDDRCPCRDGGIGFAGGDVGHNHGGVFLEHLVEQGADFLHRTFPALVDIYARMSARAALNAHLIIMQLLGSLLPLKRQLVVLQIGTGSPCGDGVIVFRVEVNHSAAFDKTGLDVGGTRHSVFLVGGDKELQRSMLQTVTLHHGQSHAEPHAIVGSQRCAAGFHPSVFNV